MYFITENEKRCMKCSKSKNQTIKSKTFVQIFMLFAVSGLILWCLVDVIFLYFL